MVFWYGSTIWLTTVKQYGQQYSQPYHVKPWLTIWLNHTQKTIVQPWYFLVGKAQQQTI